MKLGDDFEKQKTDELTDEDDFDELEHSMLRERKFKPLAIFSKTEGPFVIVGIVIVVFIVLYFTFQSGDRNTVDDQRLSDFESQIAKIEKKLNTLEWTGEKLALLEKQSKIIESFMERFDRMEAAMTLRMDLLEKKIAQQKDLNKAQMITAKKPMFKAAEPKKTTSKKAKKNASKNKTKKTLHPTSYHHVKAGETLYSISRRYGLSVSELRNLNKSISGESIYVGQKLVVNPKM